MTGKTTEKRGKKKYFLNRGGVRGWEEVTRAEYEAVFPDKKIGHFATASTKVWPKVSVSAGVDPSQINEAEDVNRKNGDNVKYVREGEQKGDAIFESAAQRRRHLKSIRLRDKASFY